MSEARDMETDQELDWEEALEEEKESSLSNIGFETGLDYNPSKKVVLAISTLTIPLSCFNRITNFKIFWLGSIYRLR